MTTDRNIVKYNYNKKKFVYFDIVIYSCDSKLNFQQTLLQCHMIRNHCNVQIFLLLSMLKTVAA